MFRCVRSYESFFVTQLFTVYKREAYPHVNSNDKNKNQEYSAIAYTVDLSTPRVLPTALNILQVAIASGLAIGQKI